VGWCGYLIALCAKKGYEMLGGRNSWGKVIVVILASFLGLLVAHNVGYIIVGYQFILENDGITPTLSDIIILLKNNFAYNPDFIGPYVRNLLLGVLFLVLGFYSIIANMVRESRNPLSSITEIRL
jgi:hypothetical protein